MGISWTILPTGLTNFKFKSLVRGRMETYLLYLPLKKGEVIWGNAGILKISISAEILYSVVTIRVCRIFFSKSLEVRKFDSILVQLQSINLLPSSLTVESTCDISQT